MNPEQVFPLAKKLIERKRPRYWELVNKIEKLSFESKILGSIEENVIVSGALILEKGAVLKSGSRIDGFAYIGKNCVIGPNAYLRGTVLLERDCRIANTELKNVVMLAHSNAAHFSYIGDSIIGSNVNFGAGAKVANLRFDDANVKVDFFGTRVNSKRRKLGALIKDNTKIGVNAFINCGVIIGKNCKIWPLASVLKSLPDNTILKP